MRVRMVLVEKKLPWTSHVIDLSKMEHATPEYQSINPNGLVPTLVHDGHTYNSHRSRHLSLSIPKVRLEEEFIGFRRWRPSRTQNLDP